jgi:hypothetical protein
MGRCAAEMAGTGLAGLIAKWRLIIHTIIFVFVIAKTLLARPVYLPITH